MSMHLRTSSQIQQEYQTKFQISRLAKNYDGTLNLDYFAGNGIEIDNITAKLGKLGRHFKWNFVISPLFLAVVILMILIIPKRLFQVKFLFSNLANQNYAILKRSIDILGSIIGLLGSFLFFLILPILIRIDSEGKAIFKQTRIGKNRRKGDRRNVALEVPFERRNGDRRKENLLGKPFEIYKFRSMRNNAEKKIGPVWATQDDPRVTNVGRFLRPWHLDEIPQFINVLKGDMSLVGPRPERPEFICKLKSMIPNYERRFQSKPGITGLAQVNCSYDSSIEDVYNKLQYDLDYVYNGNILTDLKILVLTLKELLPNDNSSKNNSTYLVKMTTSDKIYNSNSEFTEC